MHASVFFCNYKAEITAGSFNVLHIKIISVQLSLWTQRTGALLWLSGFPPCRDQTGKATTPCGCPQRPALVTPESGMGPAPFHRSPPSSGHASLSHKPHPSPQPDSTRGFPFPMSRSTHHQGILLCLLSLLRWLLVLNFHTNLMYLHFLSS